jgi:hypothetical protein
MADEEGAKAMKPDDENLDSTIDFGTILAAINGEDPPGPGIVTDGFLRQMGVTEERIEEIRTGKVPGVIYRGDL